MPLFARLALRELRGGLGGFHVFVACIALGVAAIAGVASLAGALAGGLERQGREILGGDVSLELVHQRASDAQRRFLAARGALSETASLRAMARPARGGQAALVQLKAVDGAYPLYGEAVLDAPGVAPGMRELRVPGTAAVDPLLLARLGLTVGDMLRVGTADLRIVATVESEPDQLSGRMEIGPRLLTSLDTLHATGLIQPGSLIRWRYLLRLGGVGEASAADIAALRDEVAERFPQAGFSIRDRTDPSPRLRRAVDRFAQFMTLVGVAVLMIGGIGVANAVATYLSRKRLTIAAFKCLGATSRTIFATYLTQVLLLAAAGTLVGLMLGALLPMSVVAFYGDALPLRLELGPRPSALALASLYGLLTALLFVLWPLGAARDLRPALLLRQDVSGEQRRPRARYIALAALCGLALFALAILSADRKLLSLYAALGLIGVLAVFLGLGLLIERAARLLRRPRRPALALALAGLAGPGSLARPVAVSLGASLTLLAAVALVNAALVHEIESNVPEHAPSYFLLDVGRDHADAIAALAEAHVPEARLDTAPMLRGRIVSLNGVPADRIDAAPNARWVLGGDRGLTQSPTLPEGSELVAGEWWAPDHAGAPLVSFEADIAEGLGLAVGDRVTVNVLGRDVETRVANLRRVDWESLGINFVMVFSPNALEGAPYNLLATVVLPPQADLEQEGRFIQALTDAFPTVTAVRVRDALDAFKGVLERVMVAIHAAGGFTVLTGAVVLAGALATSHRRRIRDAVVYKTLGATRGRILAAHFLEYAILALATGLVALGLSALIAYLVLTLAMDIGFAFSGAAAARAIGLALALVLAFGAAGTWRTLSVRPARHLRAA